ncbi:MAG: ATPase [Terrestrivirus sp.]|uniref:ATPase n=1 Tax=Terrestrivirus sp. TaxID=2487775 RepID=A0A3G4ZLA5_9VIRU|nr:MAG: ATPase [Terrestrivirus sp.]
MKIDKKFEERLILLLEKYALRPVEQNTTVSEINSELDKTPKDDTSNLSETVVDNDNDNDDNDDNEENWVDDDSSNTNSNDMPLNLNLDKLPNIKNMTNDEDNEDDDDEYTKLKQKYYFYYKIVKEDELDGSMEAYFDDEVENINKVEIKDQDFTVHGDNVPGNVIVSILSSIASGMNTNNSNNTSNLSGNNSNSNNNKNKRQKKMVIINFFDDIVTELMQKSCDVSSLYESEPYITLMNLLYCVNNLRKYKEAVDKPNTLDNSNDSDNLNKVENDEILQRVLKFVEELFVDSISKMDKMIANKMIDFDSLWYYFDVPDKIYLVKNNDEDICFKQSSFYYETTDGGEFFTMNGRIITAKEKKLRLSPFPFAIRKFKGTKEIKSFEIKAYDSLNEDEKIQHKQNGERVFNLLNKISHMNLKGKQYVLKRHEIASVFRDERVMVDHEGGEIHGYDIPYNFANIEPVDEENLTENDKLIMYPFISAYNLGTNKLWGIAHVKNLTPIEYNKNAFEQLVLEKNKKGIILGLIKNYKDEFNDFIETKGKGLIFLLYGPPGVGKTLSSEATCELLEKPLYSISVSDLGTHPDTMESILDSINEVVKRWNAVMLIDEVDIFLEDREYSDITRNAMVCVFLKFLEYHDNIIFLTTNRLKSIDTAIKSRINLFLAYDELTENKRKQVWIALLKKWNVNVSDSAIDDLSEHKINGREIRNYLKLSLSILKEQGITPDKLTDKQLLRTLKDCFELTKEFNDKIPNNGMYI